jgi:SPP1 gp7 family putative phage head morphogenesis protein
MDSPASDLDREMRRLSRQWRRRFNEAAPEIAALFARRARGGADATLLRMLKQAGFTVPFRMTKGMRDVVDATVAENVSLIRSIPEKYLGDVQTSVMQSVKAGRDLATLSKDLRKNYGVSYRRAALIARDQNNKATSALMRVRQVDLGLEKGVWLHSHAGKEPRPTHLANHGKKFDLKEGWFDPDPRVRKRILPGELINCRCVWKPVVPGLT